MKTFASDILRQLSLTQRTTAPKTKHIFLRLINALESELSFQQKADLLWLFSMAEKGLAQARKGNRSHSRFYFEEIASFTAKKEGVSTDICNVIVEPAIAFYEYHCTHELDDAIQRLLNSIVSINRLINEGQVILMAAAVEQYLNVGRVLYKQQKTADATRSFGGLIRYLVTGDGQLPMITLSPAPILSQWSEQERTGMLDYVTDAALFKYLADGIGDEKEWMVTDLFGSLTSESLVIEGDYWQTYMGMVRVIVLSLQRQDMALLEPVDALLFRCGDMPRTLQFLFLRQVEKIHQCCFGGNEQLTSGIRQYAIDKLNLGHLYPDVIRPVFIAPIRLSKEGVVI